MLRKNLLGRVVASSCLSLALSLSVSAQVTPTVFINEIHYDNTGTDVNEGIEIAGTAGTNLAGWSLVLYNGGNGASYSTKSLTGTIPTQQNGFGTVYVSYTNSAGTGTTIQNGSPDGVALVNAAGTVVQFLSYEGTFTAVGGPANGLISTAITTSEAGTEAVGRSLQLVGTGNSYTNFTWSNPIVSTSGAVNTGQSFTAVSTGTKIRDIQGLSHTSPKVGQAVTGVPGIVTAVGSKSFYFQDPSPDTNVGTSEGLLVYVGTAPTVAVGDSITVSGTITEYVPTGDTTSLSVTQISTPVITKLSSGNALPAPIVIGTGGRIAPTSVIDNDNLTTFDPTTDGIDFYESLEGMRVQVNNPVVVGPTNSFGDTVTLPDNGANGAGVRTGRGGVVVQAADFNPERLYISSALVANPPKTNVGDRFNGAILGVLDYSFNNYKLFNTSALPTPISGGLTGEVTTLLGSSTQLTVGAMNCENFYPGSLTAAGALKSTKLAQIAVNNLKSPDIISLEEVQDNNGPTNDAVVASDQTLTELINAIVAAGGPTYQAIVINPVDDQDGGQPGGNIRVAMLYNPSRVSFVSKPGSTATTANSSVGGSLTFSPGRIDPTNTAFNASRKPLTAEFTFNGQRVIVIGNHFNSKGGDQPLYGKNQPPVLSSETQRLQQATAVNSFVSTLVSQDPAARVVVLGDINDFQFSAPMNALKGTILTDLTESLPVTERYTYNFEGNAQALDHILVTNNLASNATLDIVHVNSEFSTQTSDHDPEVARITIGATTPVQLFSNLGFETGTATPWVASPASVINNAASPAARTGSWKAWLNGLGTTSTQSLYQQVTIPSTVSSASLSFYLQITTAETTTTAAYDKLQVQIRNSAGTVLATLATYSNLNKSTTYLQKTFDLSAYKGQTIRVYFLGTEDSSLQTSFLIDDTSLTTQ